MNFPPVWSGTGDPLGSDFADEQTVARAANVLLPCWGVLNGLQRESETHKTVEVRRQIQNQGK